MAEARWTERLDVTGWRVGEVKEDKHIAMVKEEPQKGLRRGETVR